MSRRELDLMQKRDLENYLDEESSAMNLIRVICSIVSAIFAPFALMALVSPAAIVFFVWLAFTVFDIALVMRGKDIDYGKKSVPYRLRADDYVCTLMEVVSKQESEGRRRRFLLGVQDGSMLECPRYLEYRDLRPGDRIMAVYVGGRAFGFALPEQRCAENRIDMTNPSLNTMVPEEPER